jgi:hypothetical protein
MKAVRFMQGKACEDWATHDRCEACYVPGRLRCYVRRGSVQLLLRLFKLIPLFILYALVSLSRH